MRLSRPRSFYGANIGNSKNGNIYEFYNEALDLAQKQGMNFTPFVNGNAVPLVVFIFAGEGEHNSKTRGSEDFIWAHYKAEYTRVNGVAFNSYFVGNELTPVYKRENGQVVMQDGYPVVDHVAHRRNWCAVSRIGTRHWACRTSIQRVAVHLIIRHPTSWMLWTMGSIGTMATLRWAIRPTNVRV